tara:strand:- start:8011 stop:8883 length:873 start_codon:yes stop_codon:yes gene_type:complete
MSSISAQNEYSVLDTVVIGLLNNSNEDLSNMIPINDTFKYNYNINNIPTKSKIIDELTVYINKLKNNNINVLRPEPIKIFNDYNNQLYIRDLGFVINNIFFISSLTCNIRKPELMGLSNIIDTYISNIIKIPENINIEGGDVIIDNDDIYIGIGTRTSMEGVEFVSNYIDFNYNVLPIEHKCTHLECCFNVIDKDTVLICKELVVNYPPHNIYFKYKNVIEITKEESELMMTNVLSIGHRTIVINKSDKNKRINTLLNTLGFKLIQIDFNSNNLLGGGFRSASLPLNRIS